jgi:hypothetical protein
MVRKKKSGCREMKMQGVEKLARQGVDSGFFRLILTSQSLRPDRRRRQQKVA